MLDHLEKLRYASFEHTLFLLLWHTGMRMGAARSIDLTDYDRGQSRLQLEHRPGTDTPLKNKDEGERIITLSEAVCSVLDDWIEYNIRFDNLPLFFFSLFNGMLVFSLGQLIYRYEPAMFMVVLIGAFFYTTGFMYRVFRDVRGKVTEAFSENAKVVIPVLLVVSTGFFLASYGLLTGYLSNVEIRTIHELSLSDPVPIGVTVGYLLVATVLSASAGGMLAALVSIPLLTLRWLLGKLWNFARERVSRANTRNDT